MTNNVNNLNLIWLWEPFWWLMFPMHVKFVCQIAIQREWGLKRFAFSLLNEGSSITMQCNTWKFIPLLSMWISSLDMQIHEYWLQGFVELVWKDVTDKMNTKNIVNRQTCIAVSPLSAVQHWIATNLSGDEGTFRHVKFVSLLLSEPCIIHTFQCRDICSWQILKTDKRYLMINCAWNYVDNMQTRVAANPCRLVHNAHTGGQIHG